MRSTVFNAGFNKKNSMLFVLSLLLVGCQQPILGPQGYIRNHHYDYKDSQSVQALKLPPDVQAQPRVAFYPVPEKAGDTNTEKQSAALSKFANEFHQLPPDSKLSNVRKHMQYAGEMVTAKSLGFTINQLIDDARQQHPQTQVAQEQLLQESETNKTNLFLPTKATSPLRSEMNINRVGANSGYAKKHNPVAKEQHVLVMYHRDPKVWEGLKNSLPLAGFRILIAEEVSQTFYVVFPKDTGGKIIKETPIYQLHLVHEQIGKKPVTIAFLTDSMNNPLPPTRTKRLLADMNAGLLGKTEFSWLDMIQGIFND